MDKKIRLVETSRIFWLGNRDSNPNKQSQSLSCYRYTIPQYFDSKSIIPQISNMSSKIFLFFIKLLSGLYIDFALDLWYHFLDKDGFAQRGVLYERNRAERYGRSI